MSKLRRYPKVYALGHRALDGLLSGPVVVQEKIDGSQFSFGVVDGELHVRSKRSEIIPGTADKLFAASVATVMEAFDAGRLEDGIIYRGEAMCGPRHNTLEYARAPRGNIVLFDVDYGLEDREPLARELLDIGNRLGVETTPRLWEGDGADLTMDVLSELLDGESFLGGMIEGVVVKNYRAFSQTDGKMLMGKFVSERFKERHQKSWGKRNKSQSDVVQALGEQFCTEARWEKAIQHLRDDGALVGEPKDIGPLMKELAQDLRDEHGDEIRDVLFDHFIKHITRVASAGFPEWYKRRLASEALAPTEVNV